MAEAGGITHEKNESPLLQAGDISGCPFLQAMMEAAGKDVVLDYLEGMGSVAVAEMRATYGNVEAIVPAVDQELKVAEPKAEHASSRRRPERVTAEAEEDAPAQTIVAEDIVMDLEPPRLERAKRSREKMEPVLSTVAADLIESPDGHNLVVQQPLTAEFAHMAAYEAVEEPQPVQRSHVQLKGPTAHAAPHYMSVPEAIKYRVDSLGVSDTPEQVLSNDEAVKSVSESVVSALDVRIVKSIPEPDETLPVQASLPRTIEELLAEPESAKADSVAHIETEVMVRELEGQERTLRPEAQLAFSVQLEVLVAETVPEERQQTARVLMAKVYELAESVVAREADDLPERITMAAASGELSLVVETATTEATAELEPIVERLLRSMGVDEPQPEQVQQYIELIFQELKSGTRLSDADSEDYYDPMREYLGRSLMLPGYAHMSGLQHVRQRFLGYFVLIQPATASV